MLDALSVMFMVVGCLLCVVGGLGLHRLDDFYSRLHAVGITDTLCSFCIFTGLILQSGLSLASLKLVLIFLFLLFTSPTSSFALANNAWQWGLRSRKSEPTFYSKGKTK